MTTANIVILGGGMVAGYAAKRLVELGLKPGQLLILSADTSIPYERPPLSKGFLAGRDAEESIRINPEDFYREHGIEVRLSCPVSTVDTVRKRLHLRSEEAIGYEKLLIATGARVRTLNVPGAELAGLHYLRTLDNSKAIRQHAQTAKRAVVIGSGFIGMEVASVLAQQGIETTMVLREDRIWKAFFSPEMSRFFEAYYTARGVRFVNMTTVTELRGTDGAVHEAKLANGKMAPCDLVVAGIGVQPATEPLQNSAIELDDGVVVNEYLEANQTGVYAAGDVANYQDVLLTKRHRVEHWDNAVSQGQHCAGLLTGHRVPFRHVPYFFSDVFDLSYEFWGDPAGAQQIVHRGDVSSNSFSAWWLREQTVMAAFAMNRPEEERDVAPKWIESRQRVSAIRLADTSHSISDAVELSRSSAH
jgi:NADPH-dependent 2,4-dienoyl-CoA reductase/sulfur reductase-like enzyme